MPDQKKKKKEGKFSKLILGLVVGGAVGSVVGVTLSDKERRDKIKKSSVKALESSKKFLKNYRENKSTKKKTNRTIWHFLNKLFYGGKK